MKKRFIVFFVFILLFLSPINLFIFNANASNNWIIDGDTVYIDDENVYLSATPHTLINDGWVVFELETKTYKGTIDVIWGFDSPSCTPHNPQIWKNYSHEFTGYHYIDRIGSIDIYNVTGWVNLGIENYNNYTVDYGNINNTYLMNISYETNKTLIIAFTSYIEFGNGDDYRLTGYYDNYESYIYYETYFDWLNWDANFEIINYEYGGMNKWFLLQDISIIPENKYKVRAWMDIPFNTIGKYWWAIKPSNRTIPKAIDKGCFYCLDPWWDSDYVYRKTITIESDYIDNDLTNFPILVVIDDATADKCNGGNSMRFLDTDNTTEYYYQIEKWVDNEDRIVWVNVTSISSTVDTEFFMYYGNSESSDNQNPPNVWDDNYVMVHHMDGLNAVSCNDSTNNGNDVYSDNGNPSYHQTGKTGYCVVLDGIDDYLLVPDSVDFAFGNGDMSISFWVYPDDTNRVMRFLSQGTSSSNGWVFYWHTADSKLVFYQIPSICGNNKIVISTNAVNWLSQWYFITLTRDGSDWYLYQDDIQIGTRASCSDAMTDFVAPLWIGNDYNGPDFEGKIDELRISKGVYRNASWVKACFHSQNQTTDFLIWGDEQEGGGNPPIITNEYPTNNTIDIRLFPVLGITVSDPDNDTMTISFYSNVSGAWSIIGTNIVNVYNGTYYQKFDEFGIYGLTYYWYVNVTDGAYIRSSGVIKFTAETTPTTPTEGEIGLLGIFGFLGFILCRKLWKNSKRAK